MPTIMLLDGNSLAYRAFFALPTDMATASGQVTNAVFGFTSMLIYLLKEHHPDRLAVAFDLPQPTFRHDLVPDYKAGRAETPDILRQQMGLVRQVVSTMNIPVLELAGFEADDIIATLATQARDRADDVIVVTGDRDAYQLVEDPHVRVLYNKRGVSDYALYDEAGIQERTGVTPALYPQYAALRGDPSDNLPGVPGVGEKTAAKLMNDYGSLDGIFANTDKCTPKLRENLTAHEATVRANATATPLIRDVPLDVDVDDLTFGGWDAEELHKLFKFLEFRTLWDRLQEAVPPPSGAPASKSATATLEVETQVVRNVDALRALDVDGVGAVAAAGAWAGPPGQSQSHLAGLALAGLTSASLASAGDAPTAYWVPIEIVADAAGADALSSLFASGVHAHDAKALMRRLEPMGVDITGLDIDTAVAAYLIDPSETAYLLDDLALRYLGVELRSPDAPPTDQLDLSGNAVDPIEDTSRRAAAVAALAPVLGEALAARNLRDLYDDIERPLVRVLARMEALGVRVDVAELQGLSDELGREVASLDVRIQELAGEPFRVNSTPQLRHILYDKLGLAPQKKTKTGFSTDAASLEKLRGQHPIIDDLLRYREVEKLRSTYGESLLAEVGADGRIHATFNQTVARTGRLSSDAPNLHNIPVRSEDGRRFRRCFIPSEGCRFLVADYNQIELRVIAHLARDPGLIEAFRVGDDIHSITAARIYSVEASEITTAQRSKAKMVSYGLAYGMESYGLAQRLSIDVKEAEQILRAYFEAFPNVRAYMDASVAEARSKGYTETLFGRRRQIPELSSPNFRIRAAGERQAMNAGIQGLAADIFKVALVRLDERLEGVGAASRIVLQVHDEVVLEVPPAEEEMVASATLEAMHGAAELSVPLEVNVTWAATWADAKG